MLNSFTTINLDKGLRTFLTAVFSFFLFTFSAASFALGLGDIQVFSKTNEPLRAQINFLNSYEIERGKILVGLATESDYQLARVTRQPIHSELRFKLDYSGSEPVVSVTTVSPIRSNSIKFLVQARWPQGKLLREYIIRLNNNSSNNRFRESVSNVIQPYRTPASNNRSNSRATNNQNINVPPPPDVLLPSQRVQGNNQDNNQGSYSVLNKYPSAQPKPTTNQSNQSIGGNTIGEQWAVRKGETLWAIATIISRQLNTSVHKTAKALHQYNLGSFLNGDIARLKKNAVLQVPTKTQIDSFSLQDAITILTPAANAVKSTPTNETKASSGTIGSSSTSSGGSAETQETSSNESIVTINDSLTAFQQQLDRVSLENADVRNQMRALRQQVDNLESIMEINNKEINKLSINSGSNVINLNNAGPSQYIFIGSVALLVLLTISLLWFLIYLIYQKINHKKLQKLLQQQTAEKAGNVNSTDKDSIARDSTEKNSDKDEAPIPKWKQRLNNKNSANNGKSNSTEEKTSTPILDTPVVSTESKKDEDVSDNRGAARQEGSNQNSSNPASKKSEEESEEESENDIFDQFITEDSENSVQLELAQAYLDLGDTKGAEELLLEVLEMGTANQRRKAKLLLSQSSI